MLLIRRLFYLNLLLLAAFTAVGQRTYKTSSVLASGAWYRISVPAAGVYKMDVPFLNTLGITGSIPSTQIRLFGNGGGMLPENNAQKRIDDLEENAIFVFDGGDGVLDGSDYVLFYAQGPDHWITDSVNRTFHHQKNLYTEKSWYYINIGGTGLRIASQVPGGGGGPIVSSFDEHYFHELDTVNFLSSGKEWFGEEFSSAPGKVLTRSFTLPFPDILPLQATITTNVEARSVNVSSRFSVNVGSQTVQQISIPSVGASTLDLYAQQAEQTDRFIPGAGNADVTLTYTPGSFNSQGWLNWFELFCRRPLTISGGQQLLFRDWVSTGSASATFQISGADAASQVWDVSDPLHPLKMGTTISGSLLQFSNEARKLHEYVAFTATFLTPKAEGRIANQNLHSSTEADLIVVAYPGFLQQAQRLAQFHQQKDGLRTVIVTTDQVYSEFGGGNPDPSAIRDFVKMYYDRYRATWSNTGKYLMLLGKGSFDYRNRIVSTPVYVPPYESSVSVDPLSTYTSDDFYGFLDDHEDINSGLINNQLDIGIGRIPAGSPEEAKNFTDKVMDYFSPAALGPWRNELDFIADDEDNNLHLQDAETISGTAAATAPVFNGQKIYLDAYHQEGGSAGGSYPEANTVINSNIYNGTLIWNFSGHGGPTQLAEEVVINQQIVNSWSNQYRLPLFITATCDFAPYDRPGATSLGENLVIRPKTGAIALMTTTRLVFAFSNRVMNNNYIRLALEKNNNRYRTLGEAVMAAKNFTYQTSTDITNNRKFTLLGDPAMTLGFPENRVRVITVNGIDITNRADTLKATDLVNMEGQVEDKNGGLLSDFTGTANLTLYDKPQPVTTLANDPTSQQTTFQTQENVLFKGKATVTGGRFSFRFRLPKDINYQYGNGKISLYAQNGVKDGNGFSNNILIGGISNNVITDKEGPEIKAWLNDEKFVNGSITNSNPVLILHLTDSSGINTGSSGIGHDITATLDNENRQYYVLNNFYESDVDDYQKGTVRYQLPVLAPGHHSLKIKVWDAVNNSSEYVLEFTVINSDVLRIDHVLNYPNPFTTQTSFWFEHNYPNSDLFVKVEIFTVSGKLIKTITQTINTTGNRSNEILWDGRDEFGNKTGRGVYIYRLYVRSFNGKTADKWERLVKLN